MSATEANKAIVRRLFEEGVNGKDASVFAEVLTTDLQTVFERFIRAWPDVHLVIEDELAENDRVCTRGRWHGTHLADWAGVRATGRTVDITYIDVWRIHDYRLVENWVEFDLTPLQ